MHAQQTFPGLREKKSGRMVLTTDFYVICLPLCGITGNVQMAVFRLKSPDTQHNSASACPCRSLSVDILHISS